MCGFFSPQTYHHLHGALSIIKGFNVKTVLNNHNIVIPINRQEANFTTIYNYYVTSAQNKRHWSLLVSGMEFISLDSLYFFDNIITAIDCSGTERQAMLTDKFEHFLSSVDPALDLVKIKISLISKINCYYGNGSSVLTCTVYNN